MLTLVVKLLDPFSFVVAGLATLLAKRWWHCIIIGAAVALVGNDLDLAAIHA